MESVKSSKRTAGIERRKTVTPVGDGFDQFMAALSGSGSSSDGDSGP